jgi:hypothetical protein
LLRQIERLLATLSPDTLKNTVRWFNTFAKMGQLARASVGS